MTSYRERWPRGISYGTKQAWASTISPMMSTRATIG